MDHQKLVPLTTHSPANRPNWQCRADHSGRHPLGVQHGADNRRRPTQGGLHNKSGTFRTNSNVLWTYQLPGNVPDYDGYLVPRTDCIRNPHGIHGRHSCTYQEGKQQNGSLTPRKASMIGQRNAHHTVEKQPIP